MKTPKFLTVIPLMVLIGAIATGCGEVNSSSTTDKQESVNADEVTNDEAATESAETVEDSLDATAESDASSSVTVDETVLVDQDNIKITATALEDGWFGTDLKLLIENNSDTSLTVQARNSSVNGYMVDTMMSEEVAPGKKANTELTFMTSGLKDCGIDTIATMDFSFHIFTTEAWEDYLDTDLITLTTSAAQTYTQTYDDSGEIFYDQNGIKIIGKGLSSDESFWGPGLIVYIENNSSQDFTVQVRDTSINGFMVDTSMSEEVTVGKKAVSAVTFFSSSLEENGITDITSIETSFHVFDTNTWDTIVDTDPIVINY